MAKLIILYGHPADPAAFEDYSSRRSSKGHPSRRTRTDTHQLIKRTRCRYVRDSRLALASGGAVLR